MQEFFDNNKEIVFFFYQMNRTTNKVLPMNGLLIKEDSSLFILF